MSNPPGIVGQNLVGHEMADVLANTNPSSAKFLAFGREGSLINQVVRRFGRNLPILPLNQHVEPWYPL